MHEREEHSGAGVSPAAWSIWRPWVLANVAGEVVGFGLAAVIGAGVAAAFAPAQGVWRVAIGALGVVAVGSVEGTAVGLAQWLVLRTVLPGITRRAWLLATVAGAVAGWAAGMALGSSAGDALAVPETPVTVALGAVAIGVGAGILLAVPQSLVLRRAVRRAGWWVPAHALAWAAGMVVAFAGMGVIQPEYPIYVVGLIGAATGLAMGALVAALTGLALVWLLRGRRGGVSALTQSAGAAAPRSGRALRAAPWSARARA